MQSTGHSSTHARSLTSMHGSAMTKVMVPGYPRPSAGKRWFRYVDLLRGPIARRGASVLVVAGRAVIVAVGTMVALRVVIPLAVPVLVAMAIALVAVSLDRKSTRLNSSH